MSSELDGHGQPINRAYSWSRLADSRFDELIGVCRGILCDGVIVPEEVHFLHDWLQRNEPVRSTDAGGIIFQVLTRVLADGRVDPDEEEEIVTLLLKFVGGTPLNSGDASCSTQLPLDDPEPVVAFQARSFCFTGKFQFGTRTECQSAVVRFGALTHNTPKKDTNFLVIGDLGSRDWLHSTSGLKIERATELRSNGHPIHIICEKCWHTAIKTSIAV